MNWLSLIVCPHCGGSLTLEVFHPHPTLLAKEGALLCEKCTAWYPITQSVPRLLVAGPLRQEDSAFLMKWKALGSPQWQKRAKTAAQKKKTSARNPKSQAQVQSVFEFKWKKLPNWGIEGSAAKFMEEWVFEKYGWKDRHDYQTFVRRHQVMVDAGCGLGREAIRMAEGNPRALVVGIELSGAVDEARKHVDHKGLPNLLLVQADLLSPCLKPRSVDFIFSEGVLHHTPSTQRAFKSLSGLLRKGGEIAFYVYRQKAPLREFADDYVREQLQNVSLDEAWSQMESLTKLARTLSEKNVSIAIPEDIPVLGIRRGDFNLQRWLYNTVFKCFWSSGMTYEEAVMVNFDWYLPRFAWRHREEEVRGWIQAEKMQLLREHIEDAGITARAVKA